MPSRCASSAAVRDFTGLLGFSRRALTRAAIVGILVATVASAPHELAFASAGHEVAAATPVKTWSFAYVFISPKASPLNTWALGQLDLKRLQFPAHLLTATRGLGAATVSSQTFVLELPPEVMRVGESFTWVIDKDALVNAFYDRFPDDFDYLVFGTGPGGFDGSVGVAGFHWTLRETTTGLQPTSRGYQSSTTSAASRSARVIGMTVMSIDMFNANDQGATEIHEFIHQFCCYLGLPTNAPPSRLPFGLGRLVAPGPTPLTDGGGHWTDWFSGGSGVMGANQACCQIAENGDGSYTSSYRAPWSRVLSDLELYLAGLIPPAAVQPMSMTTPDPMPPCHCLMEAFPSNEELRRYEQPQVFTAKRTALMIDDIVKANGPRIDIPVSALRVAERASRRLEFGFHSRWLTQSEYPVMHPGEVRSFWVVFRNTGTASWTKGIWGRQVNLALNRDDRTPYALGMADGWLWEDRIATTIQDEVGPGELGVFAFRLRAPMRTGDYSLNLRPVADGNTWLEDEGVFWTILVR